MVLLKSGMILVLVITVTCYDRPEIHIDMGPESGYGWAWTEWRNEGDCSVMCGATGVVHQSRHRRCFDPYESCFPAYVRNFRSRKVACKTEPCGYRCPIHNTQPRFLPHPTNPNRFYQCSWGVAFLHFCHWSTVWNQALSVCDWPQ